MNPTQLQNLIGCRHLAVAATALLLCTGSGWAQSGTCTASSQLTEYKSAEVQFKFPRDWQVAQPSAYTLAVYPSRFGSLDNAPCAMFILWFGFPEGMTLDLANAKYVDGFRSDAPQGVSITNAGSPAAITIDNAQAIRTPLQQSDARGNKYRYDMATVKNFRDFIVILPFVPAGEYTKANPILLALQNSIKLFGMTRYLQDTSRPPAATPTADGAYSEYWNDGFSFQYSRTWMINRTGRDDEGYQLVQLIPASGSGEVIEFRYQKVAATYSGLCASTAQHLRGIVQDLEIGGFFFDDRTVAEDFNAGTVSTVLSTNNFRYPNIDTLSSMVCADGNMANVIYAYDHTRVKSTGARDRVMSTLAFSLTRPDPASMLVGRWDGQANTMAFFADGRLKQELPVPFEPHYGTYRIADQRLLLQWQQPKAQDEACGFSVKGDTLNIDCGAGRRSYSRSRVQ